MSLANGFNPALGNSFTILTSTAISGTFATVSLPPLSSGSWQVTYNATTVVLTVSALAAPGTLYSTGFENPPFTLGNLAGQDGWQVSSVCGLTGPATGLVENTLVQSGSQAVSVDGSVTCQSGPYHSDSSTGPLIELSAGIYIASSSSQTQWQFAGLGPGLAPFIGGVGILATGQIVAITAGLPTVGTWTYNAWNNLDFLFNFSTQTYAITLNGVPLASGLPFCGDNGPCAGAPVSTYGTSLFDTFGGGNDTGYIDNFAVSGQAVAISSISPTSATAGGGAFTLTVNGGGFVSGATVSFNGNARTTTFLSATQLTAAILAADLATAGTFNVVVANPAAGGTCLLLQIESRNGKGGVAWQIVSNHLKLLETRQIKEIAKQLGRPLEHVQVALDVIRFLDPYPGLRYSGAGARQVEPDVYIFKESDEYIIQLNDDDLPQLRLNAQYRKMLDRDQEPSKEIRNYVKDRYAAAIQLIKNIEQRKQTILKVCQSIVRRQLDFLEHGIDQLKPMMIKEVAEEIGVHPSTVSRAVASKYADTPQGVFELRYFFSEAVQGTAGSATPLLILKRRVKKMIEEEDAQHPLTDEQITARLKDEGIDVTRRTVAKYREDMKIPSTHQRRVRA